MFRVSRFGELKLVSASLKLKQNRANLTKAVCVELQLVVVSHRSSSPDLFLYIYILLKKQAEAILTKAVCEELQLVVVSHRSVTSRAFSQVKLPRVKPLTN